ncbi:MAG: hypothetical protein NW217_04690 [Hyphomicrobiaceae bacterium]|nr:hypothetical protein [Hyphomicrobiaceae bacterium]
MTKSVMTTRRLALSIAGALAAGLVLTAPTADRAAAKAVSDRLKVACSGDYKRFCNGYAVGSSSLRSCMRAAGKRLSEVCIRALVDEGEVPRSVLSKMR